MTTAVLTSLQVSETPAYKPHLPCRAGFKSAGLLTATRADFRTTHSYRLRPPCLGARPPFPSQWSDGRTRLLRIQIYPHP